ncbi:MAG: alpha/beta fold hydrolase [SAR324 cluster bacterium]
MTAPRPMTASPVPQSHFVEHAGLKLHHLDWGNAGLPALALVPGIRLHAHVWSHFARAFRDRYHILALDQRGHGDSAWSPESHYHLHDYYEDLRAVLEHRGIRRLVLIGHSLGARVSMLYAHLHPEDVERLVLVDMGAGLPAAALNADFSRVTETPPPKDFASPEEAMAYLGRILKLAPKPMIEESVVHGLRRKPDGRYTWKYDPALGGRPQPRPGTREWDLWEAVKTIRSPTLLLRGELSRVVSREIAQRMGEDMPDCRVEQIDRAGHALFTDRPEAFAASVGRFLAQ